MKNMFSIKTSFLMATGAILLLSAPAAEAASVGDIVNTIERIAGRECTLTREKLTMCKDHLVQVNGIHENSDRARKVELMSEFYRLSILPNADIYLTGREELPVNVLAERACNDLGRRKLRECIRYVKVRSVQSGLVQEK